jgi:hypothetical protein
MNSLWYITRTVIIVGGIVNVVLWTGVGLMVLLRRSLEWLIRRLPDDLQ